MQTAIVTWTGEQEFMAMSPSGHAIPVDSDRESNKAPGPMELVLMALGACTATDVVVVLQKKRQKLESLEVICSGERASEPPTVWTKLEILYRLRGELDESAGQACPPVSRAPTDSLLETFVRLPIAPLRSASVLPPSRIFVLQKTVTACDTSTLRHVQR